MPQSSNYILEKLEPFMAGIQQSLLALDKKINDSIGGLRKEMNQRFEQVDQRFEQVDQRFEQVDQRFEQVDQRFEQVDQRFEDINQRFVIVEQDIEYLTKEIGELKVDMKIVKKQTQAGVLNGYEERTNMLFRYYEKLRDKVDKHSKVLEMQGLKVEN